MVLIVNIKAKSNFIFALQCKSNEEYSEINWSQAYLYIQPVENNELESVSFTCMAKFDLVFLG